MHVHWSQLQLFDDYLILCLDLCIIIVFLLTFGVGLLCPFIWEIWTCVISPLVFLQLPLLVVALVHSICVFNFNLLSMVLSFPIRQFLGRGQLLFIYHFYVADPFLLLTFHSLYEGIMEDKFRKHCKVHNACMPYTQIDTMSLNQ